jgi:hypothetical protein
MVKIFLLMLGVIVVLIGAWKFATTRTIAPSNTVLSAFFKSEFAKYESQPTYTSFTVADNKVTIILNRDLAANFPRKPSYVRYPTADLQGYYGRVWGMAYSRALGVSPDVVDTIAIIQTPDGRKLDTQFHSRMLP